MFWVFVASEFFLLFFFALFRFWFELAASSHLSDSIVNGLIACDVLPAYKTATVLAVVSLRYALSLAAQ